MMEVSSDLTSDKNRSELIPSSVKARVRLPIVLDKGHRPLDSRDRRTTDNRRQEGIEDLRRTSSTGVHGGVVHVK